MVVKWLVLISIFFSAKLFAISNGFGIINSNLNTIQIGERGSTLGGILVARVDDLSAAFYNPAGLTHLAKNSFSASASSYTTSKLELTDSKPLNKLNSVASFVSSAIKKNKFTYAFSVCTPLYSENNLDQIEQETSKKLYLKDSYASNFNIISPGLSIAYQINSNNSIGASIKLYNANLKSSLNTNLTAEFSGNTHKIVGHYQSNFESNLLRAELGYQFEKSGLSLGFLLKSPTQKISSKGNFFHNQIYNYSNSLSQDTTIDNISENNLDFDFQLPPELKIGAAYLFDKWDIEFDFSWSGNIKNKPITKKTITKYASEIYTDDWGTSVTNSQNQYNINSFNFKSKINYGISSSYRLGKSFLVAASIFTDYSPTSKVNSDTDLFTPIDLKGYTVGISRFSEVTSMTISYFQSQGTYQYKTTDVFNTSYTENLNIKNMGITLSGSVYY